MCKIKCTSIRVAKNPYICVPVKVHVYAWLKGSTYQVLVLPAQKVLSVIGKGLKGRQIGRILIGCK